jgi:hypothetical protein
MSIGSSLPIGGFAEINGESLVSYINGTPTLNNFSKTGAGFAKQGVSMELGFTYFFKRNAKWSFLFDIGQTNNSVDVLSAEQVLKSSLNYLQSQDATFISITSAQYTINDASIGTSYRAKTHSTNFEIGSMVGIGILNYPHFEINYQANLNYYPQSYSRVTYTNVGAEPSSVAVMYKVFSKIYWTWHLKNPEGKLLKPKIDFGFKVSYRYSDFTYYEAFDRLTHSRRVNTLFPRFSESMVNYRLINIMVHVAYRF